MFALGLLLWFAKDISEERLQKGMGAALLVGDVAGLIVTVLGKAGGTLRVNGWILMMLYAVFGPVFAYLLFLRPRMKQ